MQATWGCTKFGSWWVSPWWFQPLGWTSLFKHFLVIWRFPEIGVPQNGWFVMEHPIKIDDLGVPLFQETPICWAFVLSCRWKGLSTTLLNHATLWPSQDHLHCHCVTTKSSAIEVDVPKQFHDGVYPADYWDMLYSFYHFRLHDVVALKGCRKF